MTSRKAFIELNAIVAQESGGFTARSGPTFATASAISGLAARNSSVAFSPCPAPEQAEEALGRAGGEDRPRLAHQVGGRAVGQVELHGQAARVALARVDEVRVGEAVGEAAGDAHRVALHVRGAGQLTGPGVAVKVPVSRTPLWVTRSPAATERPRRRVGQVLAQGRLVAHPRHGGLPRTEFRML